MTTVVMDSGLAAARRPGMTMGVGLNSVSDCDVSDMIWGAQLSFGTVAERTGAELLNSIR